MILVVTVMQRTRAKKIVSDAMSKAYKDLYNKLEPCDNQRDFQAYKNEGKEK